MLRFLLLASLVACSLGAARLRQPRLDGRIVGGRPVSIDDYPYQLSYEYDGEHICGGSIISPVWVVTAASCIDGKTAARSQFRAGTSIRGAGGTLHTAYLLIQHPFYNIFNNDYDIGVARVITAFTYGPGVQPITLTTAEPPAATLTVVSGWGSLSSGGSLPSQLQAVEVPIVDRAVCNSDYAQFGGITVNMICAGGDGGGKGFCNGDEGGPLAVNGRLVGIVSWQQGCAEPNFPGVYSNVYTLHSWVTSETGVP